MLYIFEAIFIGFYNCIIYYIISVLNIDLDLYLELLLIGFFKHLIGYYSGIHQYYCNNNEYNTKNKSYINKNKDIIIESCMEAIGFLFIGIIVNVYIDNKYYLYFIIGFTIHILAELLGYHKYYIKNYCLIEYKKNK
jgi:hypothetical protein